MLREIELQWLAKQTAPMWGGHLERGEPPNPDIQEALSAGLIQLVENRGYIITPRGRAKLPNRCPTCGQVKP